MKNTKRICAVAAALRFATAAIGCLTVAAVAFAGVERVDETAAVRTTRDITLDDAVQIAIRQNPDILRARQEIERTRGLVIEVRAQALPRITVTNTYNQQDKRLLSDFGGAGSTSSTTTSSGAAANSAAVSGAGSAATTGTTGAVTTTTTTETNSTTSAVSSQSATTGGGGGGSSFGTQDKSWNITIQASQLIYSGGQVAAAMRIAKFTEDSSYYSLRDTVDTVISNVRKQFYVVLLDRALIDVQEESIRVLERQLSDQENRFQAGTVPRFNVLQAEVALANARPTLIRARNTYNLDELRLAKLLGINYETAPPGAAPINPVGKLSTEEKALPVAEAIEMAKERRPLLKVQRLQILIQGERINVALAGYQPRLSVSGGYEFRNRRGTSHLDDVINGWFFGVNGSWNIFDGFETYGQTKQAKAQLEQSRITYFDSVQQVELEVQQALALLRNAIQTIASQGKAVEAAEEAVRLAQERFAAGAGTQLDVLNAQVALQQARTTAYQALYDYEVAIAEFDRVTSRDTQWQEGFDDPLTRRQREAAERRQRSAVQQAQPSTQQAQVVRTSAREKRAEQNGK